MSGGTNNIKKPSHGPEGGPGIGGQYPMTPPQMVTGGPYGPGPGGVPPQWGQGGQPQPNQQFGGWNPGNIGQQMSVPTLNAPPDSAQMQALKGQLGTGGAWNPGGQLGGLIGGGQQPQRRFPGMNIPGLLQYNQIDN